jgi:DNA polymerase-4
MEREILHINTDDFYASLLRLRDPALRRRAVVVAGPPPRGMVLSASYEAREEGVSRGMTVSAARRLCAGGAFVPPDWELFRRASGAIFGVLRRYSPLVEPASLDEGYIDYTGCRRLFGHVLDTGTEIKAEIARETGLAVSVGVASSKLVSHVASRTAKRAHLVDVYAGYERSFLAPIPIGRFPIVDPGRAALLSELGISRVGDVLLFTEDIFAHCFGPWGKRLYRGATGEDHTPVRPRPAPEERVCAEEILEPDRVSRVRLEAALYRLAERLGERLRAEHLLARAVLVEVRYADGAEVTGAGRLTEPSSDDYLLYEAARGAFARLFTRRVRVRRIALSVRGTEPEPAQCDLFAAAAGEGRTRRLRDALDTLRTRFPDRVAPAFGRALDPAPAAARRRNLPIDTGGSGPPRKRPFA